MKIIWSILVFAVFSGTVSLVLSHFGVPWWVTLVLLIVVAIVVSRLENKQAEKYQELADKREQIED